MIFDYLKLDIPVSDEDFNSIYPAQIRELALRHFTPVDVARRAAEFLVPFPGAKVLDIGSGAGKFCLVGAASTKGNFTGVEQRENLVQLSKRLALNYRIANAKFIQANITEIDFAEYESFYFYNSFHENIDEGAKMDTNVVTDPKYYSIYSDYVSFALANKKPGTRLVTYWSPLHEVPPGYEVQFTAEDEVLKFWEKVR